MFVICYLLTTHSQMIHLQYKFQITLSCRVLLKVVCLLIEVFITFFLYVLYGLNRLQYSLQAINHKLCVLLMLMAMRLHWGPVESGWRAHYLQSRVIKPATSEIFLCSKMNTGKKLSATHALEKANLSLSMCPLL